MTPTLFKALLPEFGEETDVRVQAYIDRADPYFSKSRWGAFYQDGVMYWVAHEITLANVQARKGGPVKATLSLDVTRKRVGEVDVTRDSGLASMQAKNPYMRTLYGQQYSELLKKVGMGAITV